MAVVLGGFITPVVPPGAVGLARGSLVVSIWAQGLQIVVLGVLGFSLSSTRGAQEYLRGTWNSSM